MVAPHRVVMRDRAAAGDHPVGGGSLNRLPLLECSSLQVGDPQRLLPRQGGRPTTVAAYVL
jgi:hypothetical protein